MSTADDVINRGKRLTFSINTPVHLVTGKLYILAKRLDVPVVSVYRHNLGVYDTLLSEAESKMGSGARKMLDDAVMMVSMSTVIREEGITEHRTEQVQELLRRSGRPDLTEFVKDLSTVELALLIDRARHRVAYPPETEDEEETVGVA